MNTYYRKAYYRKGIWIPGRMERDPNIPLKKINNKKIKGLGLLMGLLILSIFIQFITSKFSYEELMQLLF